MGLGGSTAQTPEDYAVTARCGLIRKYCRFSGKKILDIGCGNGIYSIEMAKHASYVVGIDVNPHSIRQALIQKEAQQITNVDFYCCEASTIELGEKFDIITMIEVLEHVTDDKALLNELKDILVEKGELVLFVPNKLYPFEVHGMHIFGTYLQFKGSTPFLSWAPACIRKKFVDERIYTEKSLTQLLQRCGFQVLTIDYLFPPLDLLKNPWKTPIRKVLVGLATTPLKVFGMSIFCIAQKND